MALVALGTGAAVGSAAGGIFGSLMQRSASSKMARHTRAFIKRQRETAYQTTVADMRKAGINPILAATRGATPGGPGGQVPAGVSSPDIAGAAKKGIEAARTAARAKNELDILESAAHKAEADANASTQHSLQATAERMIRDQDVPAALAKGRFDRSPTGRKMLEGARVLEIGGATAKTIGEGILGLVKALF